ncbi:hypothetical protein ACFYUV_11270 [Nonomuraea sp. NPDC003560]|uniref:hypothetical protein n=1 Tax=Nonomuraea sp. NPDC003560 TaxID=3364341 RepID=UPI00368C6B41
MHHRTYVNDDATSTPVRSDAETARPELEAPACRWCRKTHLPLRRPVEQVRPLLEGNGAPVHGCDPCMSLVERGLAERGLQLLAAPGCRPWCAGHNTDPEGFTCIALPEAAPVEPGHAAGRVVLWFDSQLGHIINLDCKVEDLTLDEAEQLLRALDTQVSRARRASR